MIFGLVLFKILFNIYNKKNDFIHQIKFLNDISFFKTYLIFKSSKYFTIETSSFNPFLLLVFINNYLAS